MKVQKNRNWHVISTINVEKNSHCWKYVKSSIQLDMSLFVEYAYFLLRLT